jgi:hypothetical protein
VQAGVVRAAERGERPRPEDAVVPDQRAVEVARDDPDVAREAFGKLEAQPFGLPPVAFTT